MDNIDMYQKPRSLNITTAAIGGAIIGAVVGATAGAILMSPSRREKAFRIMKDFRYDAKEFYLVIRNYIDTISNEESLRKRPEEKHRSFPRIN